jgi:hypothetical protein
MGNNLTDMEEIGERKSHHTYSRVPQMQKGKTDVIT